MDDLLDEFPEGIAGVLIVDVFDQFGDDFCIRFRFEFVTLLLQEHFDIFVVRDDSYKKINKHGHFKKGRVSSLTIINLIINEINQLVRKQWATS